MKNKEYFKRYSREYRKKHPDRIRRTQAKARKKHLYGPNAVEHHDKCLKKQKGHCAICGRRMKPPHQDHCHKTKKLRGLLCGKCNRGLGHFNDSPKLLRKAARYIERHTKAGK